MQKSILHICKREVLRPVRDEILRLSGFCGAIDMQLRRRAEFIPGTSIDLVLVDVEGEDGVREAERVCSEIKTSHHGQLVAVVCNCRVAILTDCPDKILRTEFDPAGFVVGVCEMFTKH